MIHHTQRERDWQRMARLMRLPVPVAVWPFFDYLEDRGKRFLVDFGTDNAEAKAMEDIDVEMEEQGL